MSAIRGLDDRPRPLPQLPDTPECGHDDRALVVRVACNGSKQFRIQCLTCGLYTNNIAHALLSPREREAATPINRDLRGRFRSETFGRASPGRESAAIDQRAELVAAWVYPEHAVSVAHTFAVVEGVLMVVSDTAVVAVHRPGDAAQLESLCKLIQELRTR